MSRDFLVIYNNLKIKMFFASIAVFTVRFSFVLFFGIKNNDNYIININMVTLVIFLFDFFYLYFHKSKISISTLIMVYTVALNIIITYLICSDISDIHLFIARDLVTINVLVLITAFMVGKRHTLIISAFLIVSFIVLSLMPTNHIFNQYMIFIILFIIGSAFIYTLLSGLIENTLKDNIDAKKEIEQLSEFKNNIIRLIFHDLKIPVNSIIELSKEDISDKTDKILFYAQNIKKQVENVLDVERLNEPEMKLDLTDVDIFEIILQAIRSTEVLALKKNIKVLYSVKSSGLLLCDKNLIERLCVNLLSNAINYSLNNKTVWITITNIENSCCISVKDEGVGIQKEHINKIFQKYYMIKYSDLQNGLSNGLGLTFCKLAVKAHNGTIQVISEENAGSEFIVILPNFKPSNSENIIGSIQNVNLNFEDFEILELKPICEKIKNIPLYKIGEIIPLIKYLENNHNPKIKMWVEQLFDAVYSNNEEYFKNLISQVVKIT